MSVAATSLEEKLSGFTNPVEMLYASQAGAYPFPLAGEFSNWRDEQKAWRETAALFDQSYHMTDVYLEGPDVVRLLADYGVNTFSNFRINKAKQYVACDSRGFVIGDAILFFLDENRVSVVGRPPVANWLEFNALAGRYDVHIDRDERSVVNPAQRRTYRYQIQGPNAEIILERVNGGALPEMQFFNMGHLTIAGRPVRCLRHGMAGEPGLEIWGPAGEAREVKEALLEAGQEFGLRLTGYRAYTTSTLEAGWIPSPLPAIYSSEEMRAYREWLPATGFEAASSLGGSFYSPNIDDYYQTPWDLGYGRLIKFDHDFMGREALERRARDRHRKKVTLVWNNEDVVRVISSMFGEGKSAKFLEWPASHYATFPFDKVVADEKLIGLSTYSGYNASEKAWLSLAMIDESAANVGAEVVLVWGEEKQGPRKPTVEEHVQTSIRAVVAPCPVYEAVRTSYRSRAAVEEWP